MQINMPDLIQRILNGDAPLPPIARFIGFRVKSIEDGRSVMEIETDERHHNPMGTVHGGIFCDVADAAMGFAVASTLQPGEVFTTLELKMNYLKQVRSGRLEARSRLVKRGRTIAMVEADIVDDDEELVARAVSTCLLRGP